MAINTGVFFQKNTQIGMLFFDGKMEETHDYSVTITKLPVEAGANITDNAYVNPDEVTLTVFVGDVIYNPFQPTLYNFTNRAQSALAQLKALMTARQPVIVVCKLAKYPSLMIKSISTSLSKENSTTLIAKITMEQIITVDQTAGSSNNDNPVSNENPSYQPQTNTGTKQGVPTV